MDSETTRSKHQNP